MGWRNRDQAGKRGYHHGNLREALVAAALSLIAEKGPAGFTFAEAARKAGVSPAAPYRHFRDRDALMADVARAAFERFEAALLAAWNNGAPSAIDALYRLGRAYLAFAREQPALYAAMFESGSPAGAYPDVELASERAFAVLRQACEAVVAAVAPKSRPPALMMALHIWSLAHGVASLYARGDRARRPIPMSPEDLLESATIIYLQGLGLIPPAA